MTYFWEITMLAAVALFFQYLAHRLRVKTRQWEHYQESLGPDFDSADWKDLPWHIQRQYTEADWNDVRARCEAELAKHMRKKYGTN